MRPRGLLLSIFDKPWTLWPTGLLLIAAGLVGALSSLLVDEVLPGGWLQGVLDRPLVVAVVALLVALWVVVEKSNVGTSDPQQSEAFSDVSDLVTSTVACFAAGVAVTQVADAATVTNVGVSVLVAVVAIVAWGVVLIVLTKGVQRRRMRPVSRPRSGSGSGSRSTRQARRGGRVTGQG